MNNVFETKRLMIRVFGESDLDYVKHVWGDDEVMAHCLGATPHDSLPKVIQFYIQCHTEKGLSVYAVVEKETGKVIGTAGFNVIDSLENVELIYHFAKEAWGKGYATEAGEACIHIAKSLGKVKTIYASADQLNVSSLKVLEKLGFKYYGLKWFEDTKKEEPYYELIFVD